MNKKFIFKNDRFKKNRGGYSRWLLLNCEKCKNFILFYQKDGPGILKRLYTDRIIVSNKPLGKELICNKCKNVLGIKAMYQKEKRPAYRLFVGAIEKKIISGNKVIVPARK